MRRRIPRAFFGLFKPYYMTSFFRPEAAAEILITRVMSITDKSDLRYDKIAGLSLYFTVRSDKLNPKKTTGGKMNKKGFSLIELLITIAIIGILAVIGIPAYVGQQKSAARTEAYNNLQSLRLLEEQSFADSGNYLASAGPAGAQTTGTNWTSFHPRFQPGPSAGLNYSYRIQQNVRMTNPNTIPWDGATTNVTPCFVAVATGVTGARTAGDIFAIDCNNNRNF